MTDGSVNIRREAAVTLQEILFDEGYSSILLHQHLKKFPATVEERDRRLYTNLVYTALEHLPTIDEGLRQWASVPLRKMKPWIASCLRLGLAQLMYMDRVPAAAAVHETVELVKRSPHKALAGFVNGVLRGALRAELKVAQPDPVKEPLKALALTYDMPVWIAELWVNAYGQERARDLLERSQGHKSVCCRVNKAKIGMDEAKELLEKELGPSSVRQSETVPEAFFIEYSGDITQWEPYRKGYLSIQDESSMLAAMATGVRPGDQVLDICGAPGGKSIVMAQLMENQGRILCRDIHEHRVDLIRRNAERLGLTCIEPQAADGTDRKSIDEESWDVILLDAPCSGLGILRSKPDIKYHRKPTEQEALLALQGELLENASRGVKKGGRLIYSTCTVNPAENEERVENFLREHEEYELADLEKELPFLPECDRLWRKYLLLYPQKGGRDGFFVAAMKRVK